MSRITIAGAGAFGTALAIALASARKDVSLWARDPVAAQRMRQGRENTAYLPDVPFPQGLTVANQLETLGDSETVLVAVPTQNLRAFLSENAGVLGGRTCVLCCKGIEKATGCLPSAIAGEILPDARIAVLTGPGFATEIARGLPSALTLAASDATLGTALQTRLSTARMRLYLSGDPVGAQLGGALKNVIAIACGVAIGAGLGESARAALMTRGYAEMKRLAMAVGASPATLAGLSGFGDLALTCTSVKSRNFSLGFALGQGGDMTQGTLEGVATAEASLILSARLGVEMPITRIVASVLAGSMTIPEATDALMSRPLRTET